MHYAVRAGVGVVFVQPSDEPRKSLASKIVVVDHAAHCKVKPEDQGVFDKVTIWTKTADVEELLKDLREAGFKAEVSATEGTMRATDDKIEISPIEIQNDQDATKINLWMRERERRRGAT